MTTINNFFGFVKNRNGKIMVNFWMNEFPVASFVFSRTFHNFLLLRVLKKRPVLPFAPSGMRQPSLFQIS
jgi:hypothetical protein